MQRFSTIPPTPEILAVKHSEDEIKLNSGPKASRRIYYNVEFDEYEKQQISILQEAIKREAIQLPAGWPHQETLRLAYSGGFVVSKCLENLRKHLAWLHNPDFHHLSLAALQMLNDGMVYQFGRDRKMRPVVYFNIPKINARLNDIDNVIQAICNVLTAVRSTMFYPYYAENWTIVMDIENLSLFRLPVKAIARIVECTQVNYSSLMETLFMLNPPFVLKASWSLIKAMLSSGSEKKIKFLSPKEYHLIQEKIHPDQLEQKYGGNAPDCVVYWPLETMQEKSLHKLPTLVALPSNKPASELEQDQQIHGSQFYSLIGNSNRFFQSGELDFHSLSPKYVSESHRRFMNFERDITMIDYEEEKKTTCCTMNKDSCSIM